MALSLTVILAMLSFQFHFVFTDGYEKPVERNRWKRALSDDDIILGLKMYERKMAGLQRKIQQQLAIMKKQKRQIDLIKYYMKRKGDDYEKEDLKGNIVTDTEKGKQNLQLMSLDNLVREVDHQEERQRKLLEELKKENTVMGDIQQRVLNNRAVCRDTHTEWKDVGSGTIRELSRQYVKCNGDELLLRFYLQKKSAAAKKVRYNYRCCRSSLKDNWQRPNDM